MSFFDELKRRNVLRVAAAYIVASWLVIQVVETLFPVFGFSDAAIRGVVIVLAVCLIPVLILAWAFELTPEGLKLERDIHSEAITQPQSSRKLDSMIMLVLALALGYFALDKFVLDPARDEEFLEEMKKDIRSDALLESFGDKSIAVLPFVDMSPNKDQEYMSDGIAEELLNLLAKVPELRVVSRSSAFAFKGKGINIPDIASQLDVVYVLEGSVRQAGDQLRITAQLIEAGTDTHLWSETYDRKLENIFQIQDDISAKVVEQLKITLLGEAPRSQQIDEQAYRMALQARYFWNRRAEGDADAALELYKHALELAPEYAPAWAGISVVYSDRADKGKIPREEGIALSRRAAERAYELDPNLADAQIRMGQWWGRSGEYAKQRKAYETALELEPNNPTALSVMGNVYANLGDFQKAIALHEQAEAIDPLGALWPGMLCGLYVQVGRIEDAENAARRAYDRSGRISTYLGRMAYIYSIQGRHEDVLRLLEDRTEDWAKEGFFLAATYLHMAIAYHHAGRLEEAGEMADKLDALDDRYESLWFTALYAMQGDLDTAFAWFEKASKEFPRHDVEYEPYLRTMMSDPRWESALARFESVYETSGL